MNVATRSRRARPEPFAVRPGIAEQLSLPYMDAPLAFAAAALAACRITVDATDHVDA